MCRNGSSEAPARHRVPRYLLAPILVLSLSVPKGALAQTIAPRGLSVLSQGSETQAPRPPEKPPEAPPEVAPAKPPPPSIPSTAPLVLPPLREPGVPPAATFELRPSAGLSSEYSDNFNLSSGDKGANLRTSLSGGLALLIDAAFTKGQIGLTLSGAHDTATDGTQLFPSLLGQVSWQATPLLTLTAADALTRSDEPSRADVLSLRRQRRTFTSNAFSLTSNYLLTTIPTRQFYSLSTFFDEGGANTISHAFGGGASTAIYETNTLDVGYEYLTSGTSGGSDAVGHSFTASFSRQLTSSMSAGLSGSYTLNTFSSGDGAAETESSTWGVSLFSSYVLPGRFALSGSLGFSRVTSDGGRDTSSVTSVTSLTYQLAPATAALSVNQGFSQTFAQGENFGIVKTRGVTGSLSYPFTPFIGGSATAYYRQNEFTGIGGGQPAGSENTYGASLSLSVQLLRWLTLGLDYSYTAASSSDRGSGYTENRARASLNATFY